MSDNIKKVVLAYSGGLDTSVIVRWLIETYGCEVVCFAADVGQKEELDALEAKDLTRVRELLELHNTHAIETMTQVGAARTTA